MERGQWVVGAAALGALACSSDGGGTLFGSYAEYQAPCMAASNVIGRSNRVPGAIRIREDRVAAGGYFSGCNVWCVSTVTEIGDGVLRTVDEEIQLTGNCDGDETVSDDYCPLDYTYTYDGKVLRLTSEGGGCTPLIKEYLFVADECLVDLDCDDGDPCTEDECEAGRCRSEDRGVCEMQAALEAGCATLAQLTCERACACGACNIIGASEALIMLGADAAACAVAANDTCLARGELDRVDTCVTVYEDLAEELVCEDVDGTPALNVGVCDEPVTPP